jgi:hypothetical protein
MPPDRHDSTESSRSVVRDLVLAFVALVGATAFGLWLGAFGAPRDFWLLISLLAGGVAVWMAFGPRRVKRFTQSRRWIFSSTLIALLLAICYVGVRTARNWPSSGTDLGKSPAPITQDAKPTISPSANPVPSRTSEALDPAASQLAGRREEPTREPRRAALTVPTSPAERAEAPPPLPAVSTPSASMETLDVTKIDPGCPAAPRPIRAPNVTVASRDLIVAAGGALFRLDPSNQGLHFIASGDYLEQNVRGVAVDEQGQIYVSTVACRKGAVVRIDPLTGEQVPISVSFKVTMGIAAEPGDGLLVSDENPKDGQWGDLSRLDLRTGKKRTLHIFTDGEAARSIAVGQEMIYVAAKRIYRLDKFALRSPQRLDFDGVQNPQAIAIAWNGRLYTAGERGPLVEVNAENSNPLRQLGWFARVWSIAAWGSDVVISVPAEPDQGRVLWFRNEEREPRTLWTGPAGTTGVFLAVAGEIRRGPGLGPK